MEFLQNNLPSGAEFINEIELPLSMFAEAFETDTFSPEWYLPAEWCEIFSLYHLCGENLDADELVDELVKLKTEEVKKYDTVLKYFNEEVTEIVDNYKDLFLADDIDELSTFGESADICRFKECECVFKWNEKE